jgi:hypothetical protein
MQIFAQAPPVYAVIFTHIEDNSPAGMLGSAQSRQNYLVIRGKLIEMGKLMQSKNIKWSFEPDWKILLAAIQYEDAATMQSTNGKNVLRFLKEDLNVAIDPHSHESQGYNYTDVAHLLDSLSVGGSKVIGGHIWDPSLPQFAEWDRFRIPVYGSKYPWAVWQGSILMGSGTPNHINDPLVSGVWRPKDRYNYFTDDPNGNIYCIGKYKEEVASINELIALYKNSIVDTSCILTSSFHINLAAMTAQNGLITIETTILNPLDSLRQLGEVEITDFTSLIESWKTRFNSNACIYDPDAPVSTDDVSKNNFETEYTIYPNPISSKIHIGNTDGNESYELINCHAQKIWSGKNIEQEDLTQLNDGFYFLRITREDKIQTIKLLKI